MFHQAAQPLAENIVVITEDDPNRCRCSHVVGSYSHLIDLAFTGHVLQFMAIL